MPFFHDSLLRALGMLVPTENYTMEVVLQTQHMRLNPFLEGVSSQPKQVPTTRTHEDIWAWYHLSVKKPSVEMAELPPSASSDKSASTVAVWHMF